MGLKLFWMLLAYFLAGAIVFIAINRKKIKQEKNHNWLKYFSFFVIVSLLFASILFNQIFFCYLSVVIISFGYFEIVQLIIKTNNVRIGIIALLFFTLCFWGFFKFSLLDQHVLLYVLFIVTVFDAFSQLTGQLLGKRKLIPLVSPNKTIEGLIGGYLFSVITSIMLRELLAINVIQSITLGIGISTFAFFGDISASWIKRKFGVKDFSGLIPGHGGFLDRFDSLIFSSLFMYVLLACL